MIARDIYYGSRAAHNAHISRNLHEKWTGARDVVAIDVAPPVLRRIERGRDDERTRYAFVYNAKSRDIYARYFVIRRPDRFIFEYARDFDANARTCLPNGAFYTRISQRYEGLSLFAISWINIYIDVAYFLSSCKIIVKVLKVHLIFTFITFRRIFYNFIYSIPWDKYILKKNLI